jgi:GMP synthase (glutamine-hydrolysing)
MAEVLVIQHAPEENLGSIADALRTRGHRWRYLRPFAGEAVPAKLDEASALVVMGGPMSVYESERYPFLGDELRLIAAAIDAGKSVLGICLGCQLIASALGARVYRGPAPEIGWYPVQLHPDVHRDPILGDIGRAFTAFHWHGDVFDLPKGACDVGHSARTLHQGFRYGSRVYGLLFHLEVTGELVDGMVGAFGGELEAAGVERQAIAEGKRTYLTEVSAVGNQVFGAWAGLLA